MPTTRKFQGEVRAPGVLSASAGWAVAYLLILAYYYSFIDYGLNLWDEGGFASGTLRTFRGEMAMRDFNPIGYLPGRYIYSSWFFDWFGVSLHSLRLSVAVLTPVMVLMVFAIARRVMSPGFSLLAAAMMLTAPGMYYNRFYPFFCVVSLFFLIRWLEKPGWARGLVLAGTIVLCVPFKTEVALFSAGLWAVLVPWRCREVIPGAEVPGKPAGRLSQGAALGLIGIGAACVLFYVWRYNVAEKFVEIVFTTRAVWGNPFPDLFPFVELWQQLGPDRMFERALFYFPLATYALVLVLLGWEKLAHRFGGQRRQAVLLATTGMGICAFGLVVWRAGFDNLIRTLPAFYILSAFVLYQAHIRLRAFLSGAGHNEKTPPWAPEKLLAAFLVALFPLIFFYEMTVGHGFYVGSAGALRENTERLEVDRMAVWTNPYEARWARDILKKIELVTEPGDAILALPLNPLFYFLTDRPNPIVHEWILPGMLDEAAQEAVVRQLLIQPPHLVILSDIAIDGREDRRFSRYAPKIHRYLRRHFQLWEKVGLFEVLLPVGPSGIPDVP